MTHHVALITRVEGFRLKTQPCDFFNEYLKSGSLTVTCSLTVLVFLLMELILIIAKVRPSSLTSDPDVMAVAWEQK